MEINKGKPEIAGIGKDEKNYSEDVVCVLGEKLRKLDGNGGFELPSERRFPVELEGLRVRRENIHRRLS